MDEILIDYLTEYRVFVSTTRANRPHYYKSSPKEIIDNKSNCPFCLDNSHLTPDVILSSNKSNIRIIPNKYPAVSPPFGFHDVIIDTKIHEEPFISFNIDHIVELFSLMQQRISDLYEYGHIKYAQIFKNDGINSGASIIHSHWQIMALDFIPPKQFTIHKNFENYYLANNDIYSNYLYSQKELLVYENLYAFAYCPEVSIHNNSVYISLKNSKEKFQNLSRDVLFSLSEALLKVLHAMTCILGDFSYNLVFQLSPNDKYDHSCFYVEILPRIGTFAGFELSTNCYVNHISPFDIAKKLKEMIK